MRCEQGHEEREGHPWVGQTGRPRGSPERDPTMRNAAARAVPGRGKRKSR